MANVYEMTNTTDLVIFNASTVTNMKVAGNASEEEIEMSKSAIKLGEDLKILMEVVPFLVPILFSLIIILGFVGNLLVVFVVLLNKNMRNTTNLLILNLAVADILFLLVCVPFTAADYAFTSAWPFGDLWCKMNQFLIMATAFVSIYTLVLMALDRYLAVVFPITSLTIRTEWNTQLAILLSWVLSCSLSSPAIWLHGLIISSTTKNKFQCVFYGGKFYYRLFQGGFFILSYFLPLLLIVCLYSVMLHTLWYKSPGGIVSKDSLRNKKRVVKLVTIVTVMFSLSWLPIQLILLLKSLQLYPVTILNISVQIGSHVLAYSNSCVNPILYAFLSPPFRAGFVKLLPCMRDRSLVEETIMLSRMQTSRVKKRKDKKPNE